MLFCNFQLHCQLADHALQLGNPFLLAAVAGIALKPLRRGCHELLLPRPDHLRGELMLPAQLRHAPLARQQLQDDLTLELWAKLASLTHVTFPFMD